ncbi:MAG TPA: response regulator transcription factor [Steroidobacteraceae bacterium]|nr:response regulator transcription factor [Steroidobacteraceae bacterium]
MRVLVVEDDQKASDYLANALRESGHNVEQVADGLDGLHLARHERFDILIVDRMLPRLDGLTLIRSLREHQVSTPVLILSALDQVDDRVKGLRAGGDDYLTKPYHFVELLARMEALSRRERAEPGATRIEVGDLILDLVARRVTRADRRIELTAREFQLLEFLMRNAGQVVTRTMILEGVWDYHFDPQTNVIDVHISRLRQAVDRGFPRPLLHTVRGAGYVLREEE